MNEAKNARSTIINVLTAFLSFFKTLDFRLRLRIRLCALHLSPLSPISRSLSQSFKYSYMNKDENPKRAENSSVCKNEGVEYKSELEVCKRKP